MLLKILHTATFALAAWLTFVLSQTNVQVAELQSITRNQQKVLDTSLLATQKANEEKLENLSTQITNIVKADRSDTENEKKLKSYQAEQSKKDVLRKAYTLVLEAEAARALADAETAQTRLKESKSLIWKSGTNYPKYKKSLQGLMKNIDITLGAWKNKNLKKDTKAIYSVIAKVIKTQDK